MRPVTLTSSSCAKPNATVPRYCQRHSTDPFAPHARRRPSSAPKTEQPQGAAAAIVSVLVPRNEWRPLGDYRLTSQLTVSPFVPVFTIFKFPRYARPVGWESHCATVAAAVHHYAPRVVIVEQLPPTVGGRAGGAG